MAPRQDAFGYIDVMSSPFPKGKWHAYVQCLRLNSVAGGTGVANGGLYYEIVGVGPVYARNDIVWRTMDVPESLIRELFMNYYCGGSSCGTGVRGTVKFYKAVVTKGLPDLQGAQALIDYLNKIDP